MKCAETRKLVRLYLDSELDAKTSLEVEQHLESCAECAGLFEAEEKFDERLGSALRSGQRTDSLWEPVESQIKPPGVSPRLGVLMPRRFNSLERCWPIAVATCVVLFAALLFWTKTRSLDLAAAVEHCHSAYVHQLTAPEFTGAVPDEIARKLGDRLDAVAFSYRPASEAFGSKGARLCHVEGVPVALILGQYRDVPVSMIVLKKTELEHFPKTKRRLESGHPIVCGRAGKFQFAARLVNDHVVCLIADAPRPQLEEWLKTVGKPG